MTLPINDYRYGLIQDDATRAVLQELVLALNAIKAGHVTSVGLTVPPVFTLTGSPVTGAGTLALSLALQAPATVWAGPASGGNATPAFRAFLASDLGSQVKNTFPAGPASGVNATATWRALVNADLPAAIVASTSLAIGSGTVLLGAVVYLPNLTPASVPANSTAEQTFTVTGLATNDTVTLNPPGVTAGVVAVAARVSAANTLAIQFANVTAGALVPAAGVYRVLAVRS